MKDMRIREWENFDWKDPTEFLIRLRELEHLVSISDLAPKTKALRKRSLNVHLERRQAALFGQGIKNILENDSLQFAAVEQGDYDAVFRRREGDTVSYTPVQLKEVVPEKLNPAGSLNSVIQGLGKYVDSSDLVVAIHHNRAKKLVVEEISIPQELKLGGLYVFGAASRDQRKWAISGDLLKGEKQFLIFDYPQPEPVAGTDATR